MSSNPYYIQPRVFPVSGVGNPVGAGAPALSSGSIPSPTGTLSSTPGTNVGASIAGGINAAANIGMGIHQATQDAKAIPTGVPSSYSLDQFGTPAYTLGQSQQQAQQFNAKNYGRGLPLTSALQGASAAAPSANPLVIGGAAVAGLIAGGLGQHHAREVARQREKTLKANIAQGQEQFNTKNIAANQALLGRQSYEDLLNRSPYNIPQSYY